MAGIGITETDTDRAIKTVKATAAKHKLDNRMIKRPFAKNPLIKAVLPLARYSEINLRLAAGNPRLASVDSNIAKEKAYT